MTPGLRTRIALQRNEIIQYLYDEFFDSFLESAMNKLKEADVDFNALPQEIRRESLRLEEALTGAMNQRDVNAFKERVIRWRDMLLRNRMD